MSAAETPAALRDVALAVAREAADLARSMRRGGVDVADTKSSVVDVVTEADRAVEELVRRHLLEQRPDDAVLGEEGEDRAGTTGIRWIVDPIDGTVNYLYGLPAYAVSIAAEVDGEVQAGVVLNVANGELFTATAGGGAHLVTPGSPEPVPLTGSRPVSLEQALVATGFGYRVGQRRAQGSVVAALLPLVRDIRRLGSCALDLCHVAEGSVDAYVEAGPQPWDHSAGGIVVREAGGRFGVLEGSLALPGWPSDNVVVAAPADGWESFTDALVTAGFLAPSRE